MTWFPEHFSLSLLAAVLLGFWLSGVAKGLMGFGQPLVAAGILPFLIPVETVLVVNALLMPFTNLAQLFSAGAATAALKKVWPVVLGLTAGIPLGAKWAALANENVLLITMGGVVAAFSILSVAAPQFRISLRAERPVGVVTGVVAGVVGALTTVNGPIFVMYLSALEPSRRLFVSAMGFLFLVSGLMITGFFSLAGIISPFRLLLAALCFPAVVLGMWIGNRLGTRLSESKFRKMVLLALFFLGLGLILRGVGAELH